MAVVLALGLGYATKAYAAPGDLDPSFDGDGKATTADIVVKDVAIQDDGKIVVAGFAQNGTDRDFALARYNTDGSPDESFGTGGKVITPIGSDRDEATSLAIEVDNKIVVAGVSYNASTGGDFALVRYNANGTLDTNSDGDPANHFDTDGKVTTDITGRLDYATGVALSGGTIVAAGFAYGSSPDCLGCGDEHDFALVRYSRADGSLVTSFGTGGKVTTDITGFSYDDYALDLVIQGDDKIVAAGFAMNPSTGAMYSALARYIPTTGSLDTTFGQDLDENGSKDGRLTTSFPNSSSSRANSVALQPDGKIVVAGANGSASSSSSDFALARYDTSGNLDATFDGDGDSDGMLLTDFSGSEDGANDVAIQGDGKIVVAGFAVNGSTNKDFSLARYNADGSLSTTFGGDGKATTDITGNSEEAYGLAFQSDGKIVAAGEANLSGSAIARYYGGDDATAPTVQSVSPTGKEVSPKANVTATFSEAMDAATITKSTFKLVKKGTAKKIAATLSYDAAAKKATLNPTNNLKRGVAYKATVTTGAKDLAGNALDQKPGVSGNQPKVWFFKVKN